MSALAVVVSRHTALRTLLRPPLPSGGLLLAGVPCAQRGELRGHLVHSPAQIRTAPGGHLVLTERFGGRSQPLFDVVSHATHSTRAVQGHR
ncbi:hypothetical protein C1I99_05325 [Micromonospora deserti]|uniref:Uncharacterized protein n=1 Tax=Micromonospora deserti TaxID=2070366 RepID=A0A2W2D907_9ACTN|nr:hypothetical protein C1I99_05325 [Micromonospora deserti]